MDIDKPKVYGDTSITDGLVTVIVGIIIIIFQHCHLFLLTTFNIRLENCTSLIKERLWFDCWGYLNQIICGFLRPRILISVLRK